jgi:hypothetical protein
MDDKSERTTPSPASAIDGNGHAESDTAPLRGDDVGTGEQQLLDLGEQPLDAPRVMGSSFALDREGVADIRFESRFGSVPVAARLARKSPSRRLSAAAAA